ncbi:MULTISPECIES: hypothetical protein [Methylovorus]|jgi:hypothetical protein|uniref:Transmembrane protein n=1 Tax=Methylovorus glucosotrophus (strain SIP3-4) TaxID=582744 RepID=C6XDH8_METGS|nr:MULTISPECIES: hypothetical protein [Methylovorus]ACT50603.1 hypothetical protein Msip34_1357 [Methylovorus glucosotrophus SIP3-4]ADQ84591.1 conserved hypothetical protein [Methylovorus sp. MP688]KAF0843988.1 hypothetical protein FNL37_1423 [Methylovorus glucosotrophus]
MPTKKSMQVYVVRTWFLLNVFVALYPPLYWAASEHRELILGLPATFVYFTAVSLSITLSILYAFWQDAANGELTS